MEDQEKPRGEIPLTVDEYLLRRQDVPSTLKNAFRSYANDARSAIGRGVAMTRAEWAEILEKFRTSPPPF